ncbi:MAG: ParA family protein [Planctomycetota bacterium]|nr:MAG: ParA family protein [Planctomycetota bacterium]
MRRIAVMNQKGGVGKTTTSVNLAAGLARAGKRVCLIDLDPQGHASLHLGIEAFGDVPTLYDVFRGERELAEVWQPLESGLHVVPANVDLAAVEIELAEVHQRESILRDALSKAVAEHPFDYVIMDCPPSLGVLTVNALAAADEVFIPLQPHFFALQGLSKLLETTQLVTHHVNPCLRVTGIALCLFETGTRLASDVTDDLALFLANTPPDAPWSGARVFETRIRRNIKLAEAPSFGQSIFDYAPKSPGAADYAGLVREVLAMEHTHHEPDEAAVSDNVPSVPGEPSRDDVSLPPQSADTSPLDNPAVPSPTDIPSPASGENMQQDAA